ncbi:MAG: hypothetical protein IPN42_00320 [Methylococcaceae bacterium]|nr:hypothetical protein [Methylococcaceae bacterium]
MGTVIEIFVVMLVVGAGAFAPLGYFIYKFGQKNSQPFGETEPHGDSPSFVNELVEKVIALVKSKTSGSKSKS